jgi:NTP pyrophosphatase (non-canonical NTP hydrolase)
MSTVETFVAAEVVDYDYFVANRFKRDSQSMMKMHAALGACGEVGELADAIKKEVIYDKPADKVNIIEEVGDTLFYLTAVCNLYGFTLEDAIVHNIKKLEKRYPSGTFTSAEAIARADKVNP